MMRRLLTLALLALAAPAVAQINSGSIQYTPSTNALTGPVTITTGPLTLSSGQFLAVNGTAAAPSYGFIDSPTTGVYRTATGTGRAVFQAANTLAFMNGVNAMSFLVYNTDDGAGNYERMGVKWASSRAQLITESAGAGTLRGIDLFPGTGSTYSYSISPESNDARDLGFAGNGNRWRNLGLTRSIQGAATAKAITDNVATAFATVAIPQTAGSNYAGGKGYYTIFCRDASNQAVEQGEFHFACHNRAGTETCTIGTAGAPTVNVIHTDATASFVAPVFTAAAGADLVTFSVQSDCTGVTPTTHTIQVRFDMQQVNTLAFP